MDAKEYIVTEADTLFSQHGFKSVTMDDIAKHLGMSKKTIYQHFADKNELVNILIEGKLTTQSCEMREHAEIADNAVHELFLGLADINELLDSLNPKLFYDLQKYHHTAWLQFKEFKEKKMGENILKNLERGIQEGLYRNDLQNDIITQMRLEQIDLVFNRHDHYTQNKHTLAQVIIEISRHFLYGICNEKGLKLIVKYTSEPIIAGKTNTHVN